MMESTPLPAEIAAVRKRLNRFSSLKIAPQLTPSEADAVKQDLAQFDDWSEYQTLGVCAESLSAGQAALESFLKALGVSVTLDLPERSGPIFLKFNTLKGAWYLDDYSGDSRGVLITFHTSEPEYDELVGTYGPFPLDLFS
jgi:hypothetical protein